MSALVAVLKTEEQRASERGQEKKDVISLGAIDKDGQFIHDKSNTEPPVSIHEKVEGVPYTVKFFNIKDWDIVEKQKEKVKLVERYIKDSIKRQKLEDSTESYKDLMENIMDEIGVKKTETKDSRFQRVAMYVELLNKQRNLDKRRREIIGYSNK